MVKLVLNENKFVMTFSTIRKPNKNGHFLRFEHLLNHALVDDS